MCKVVVNNLMIHYTDPNRFVKNEIASDKEESVTKSD